jgi:hypothetical protein
MAKKELVPNPCKKVCDIDFITQVCYTCGRTREEIVDWSGRSEKEKLAILSKCMLRLNLFKRKEKE